MGVKDSLYLLTFLLQCFHTYTHSICPAALGLGFPFCRRRNGDEHRGCPLFEVASTVWLWNCKCEFITHPGGFSHLTTRMRIHWTCQGPQLANPAGLQVPKPRFISLTLSLVELARDSARILTLAKMLLANTLQSYFSEASQSPATESWTRWSPVS
jgi:hypothetical protein